MVFSMMKSLLFFTIITNPLIPHFQTGILIHSVWMCSTLVSAKLTSGWPRMILRFCWTHYWTPGPSHCQKNAFSKRAKKWVYATRHPGDHRKLGEKLQCQGSWGVEWGQGEIVCEGYWPKSMNEWISCTSKASSWKFCVFNFRKNKINKRSKENTTWMIFR